MPLPGGSGQRTREPRDPEQLQAREAIARMNQHSRELKEARELLQQLTRNHELTEQLRQAPRLLEQIRQAHAEAMIAPAVAPLSVLDRQFPDPPAGDPSLTAMGDQMPTAQLLKAYSVNVQDPVFGAVGDGGADDSAAIQAALDTLGLSGVSGGIVWLPHTGGNYRVTRALVTYPHVRLVGEQTRQSGASLIKADVAGNYTNGPYAAKAVFKQGGADPFWHGGGFEHIAIDCNNAPGLSGMRMLQAGENSKLDFVRVDNSGVTPRTVNDAVTNATPLVTSATGAFTSEDVNAVVSGTRIPAGTKIDIVNSPTSVTLNNAATGSGSGGALTINRPADAVVFDGGAATGYIRSLNGINNAGALLRLTNQSVGTWLIEQPTGDSNGGGLIRVSAGAVAADPISITVFAPKGENPGAITKMDPVFLIDNSDMVSFNLIGGAYINSFAGRDVIRIDQPVMTRGGPSISLTGVEGANPFNTGYTNIIRNTATGELEPIGSGTKFYPDLQWGRDLKLRGGSTVPTLQTRRVSAPFGPPPDIVYNAATWTLTYLGTALMAMVAYNSSNVQNDGGAWQVSLSAGTWRLDLLTSLAANQAIATIDISFDGGATFTAIGTADLYAAAASAARFSFSGIVVARDGTAHIRFRALTRNGASTGWVLGLTSMELTRTA